MTAGGSGRGKYNIKFFGCRSAQASVNGLRIGNCRPMGAPHQGREASHRGNDVDSRQPQNRNSPSRGARKFIGLKPRATSKWCDLSHAGSQSVSPQVQYCRSSPCFSLTGRHRVCIAGGLECPKALECPKRLIMSLQLVAASPPELVRAPKERYPLGHKKDGWLKSSAQETARMGISMLRNFFCGIWCASWPGPAR